MKEHMTDLTEKNLEAVLLNLTKTDRPISIKPTTWFGNPAKTAQWYTCPNCSKQSPLTIEWVGLTEQDFSAINQSSLTKLQAATCAESILKETWFGNPAKTAQWYTCPNCSKQSPLTIEWVGLTEQDFSAINQSSLTKLQAATCAESILKEKNT